MNSYVTGSDIWQRVLPHCRASTPLLCMLPLALQTDLCQRMAHYLLCAQPQDDQACESCRDCRWFVAQTHPDYYPLQAEMGAFKYKLESVQTLLAQLVHRPQRAPYHVIVIEQVHAMHPIAMQTLLKALEEYEHCRWILTTNLPGLLLPSFRSRCRLLRLGAYSTCQEPPPEFLMTFLRPTTDPIALAKTLSVPPISITLHHLLQAVSDIIRLQAGLGESLTYPSCLPLYQLLLGKIQLPELWAYWDALIEAQRSLGRQYNHLLVLESLLIQWHRYWQI